MTKTKACPEVEHFEQDAIMEPNPFSAPQALTVLRSFSILRIFRALRIDPVIQSTEAIGFYWKEKRQVDI